MKQPAQDAKYRNLAQFFLGVVLVNDPSLLERERLALNCLAATANWRTAEAHPGNAKLMQATGCTTRQGVNAIMKRLIKNRELVTLVSEGHGGRGIATTYRIKIEDDRFPAPKPAPPALHVSEDKPATVVLQVSGTETCNCDLENPQPAIPKPATGYPETRNSSVAYILKSLPKSHPSPSNTKDAQPQTAAAMPLDDDTLSTLVEKLKQVFTEKYEQEPTWTSTDYRALDRLFKQKPDIQEIALRYQHFLASELPFHQQQGGSPVFFCKHFDGFIDRVETSLRSSTAVRPPRGKQYSKPEPF